MADKFEMVSGIKLWLTKEDRILLRMDLYFGAVYGSVFESTKVFALEDLGEDYIAHARARNALFDISPEFDEGPDYLETVERRRSAED